MMNEEKNVGGSDEAIIEVTENGIISGFEILCRLCANQSSNLISIYSEEGISNDLGDKMNMYLPVKVSKTDILPLQCCFQCASTVLSWHELVVASVEADRRLRHIQTQLEKQIAAITINANVEQPEPSIITTITTEPGSSQTQTLVNEEYLVIDSEEDNNDNVKDEKKRGRHRRKKSEIIPDFYCDICEKGFTRKHDMVKHRAKQHQNTIALVAETTSLVRVKKNDLDSRPYFCHICGKSYRISSTLSRHIKELHHRVKKHSCDVCGRKFAAKASLNDHRNIHTNDRPYVCDTCGKCFKQKATLHIHKLFHTNVFRFTCFICGKKYRRARDLKVHSWLHTGHRPYSCHICGSMFRLSQDLKRHQNIHNNQITINQFVCNENQCGATFTQQRYLKRHQSYKHTS